MPAKRKPSSIESLRCGALSVAVKPLNAATCAAMREALEGKDLTEWADLEDLKGAAWSMRSPTP
jgi:hypothetical protein